jgi:hypothetical protein
VSMDVQALASLAASSGNFLEERLDRVRTYYECLNLPFEVDTPYIKSTEVFQCWSPGVTCRVSLS